MDLSSITLLILSHYRQHCLKATLQFYKDIEINLLVLDNSDKPLDSSFIPDNCNYIFTQIDFAARSKLASSLIKTKYTIIGADDEIYLPHALSNMKEFLEKNNDYVAVGGNTLAIWRYGNYIAGNWAYKRTFEYHNQEKTSLDRIKKHTGGGSNPLTSFFTCNLTRSKYAKLCLAAYGHAPVLSTDAISVLIICGGGKSKYLNELYWIRNWNQFPRSHANWNRSIALNKWWDDPNNLEDKKVFESYLERIYYNLDGGSSFKESWCMILKATEAMNTKINRIQAFFARLNEFRFFVRMKFLIKSILFPTKLPKNFSSELELMRDSGIYFNNRETFAAVKLVSSLIPYRNW